MALNWIAERWPLPAAVPIDDIQPQLKFVTRNGTWTADYSESKTVVKLLKTHAEQDKINNFGSQRMVFIVHGFQASSNDDWIVEMTTALLQLSDITVLVPDWSKGAAYTTVKYPHAASNTVPVGTWLGDVALSIKQEWPDKPIHGIGHSLGSHVIGMAGRQRTPGHEGDPGAFYRITGLDPAGPYFESGNWGGDSALTVKGLRWSDAKDMVDVIHTCGYMKHIPHLPSDLPIDDLYHYGDLTPMGTIDFYPNYGYMQPGCGDDISKNHARCDDLFTWSISHPDAFQTRSELAQAPSITGNLKPGITEGNEAAQMGFYVDIEPGRKKTGLFYIETSAQAPWTVQEATQSESSNTQTGCCTAL